MVILAVVAVVVLLLAARAWKSVAPTASQITEPGTGAPVPTHGQEDAAQEVRGGNMPDLNEMRNSTSEHSDQLQEALEQTQ